METKFDLNLTSIPRELKLIINIITLDDKDFLLSHLVELKKDIDWNLFLDLALHHRIYPLLAIKLKRLDVGIIPQSVINTIQQHYLRNTLQMLYITGEMDQLNQIFNDNKIKVLMLKGPVLGSELYGDVSLRTSGDLDILIPIQELNRVDKILLSCGYDKHDYIKTILNDWTWRHHHVTYFHYEKKVKVEIHWRLNPGPGREPSFQELWERKRLSSITSYPMYYLGKEDLFFFLATHGSRHGWSRLRWLIDIKQLVKQQIDWQSAASLLRKYQFLRIGGQALILCSEVLNTPISNEMNTLLKGKQPKRLAQEAIFYLEKMINLHNGPLPRDIEHYHKRHLFALMSRKHKLFFILSFFYPYPEDAMTLPLPRNLHFLYFFLRPILWAWRKTKHHAVRTEERL